MKVAVVIDGNGTGWNSMAGERAFGKATRARRRASLLQRLRRGCLECAKLAVHDAFGPAPTGAVAALRDIPLDAITGSTEPNRASLFDGQFRPAPSTRRRWLRVWHAEQDGAGLPPISVVAIGAGFAIRDGHHRVSVARARGAVSIAAVIA